MQLPIGEKKPSERMYRLWIVGIVCVAIVGVVGFGLVAYTNTYRGRVLPGVHVGDIAVGGMTEGELTVFLRDMADKLATDGVRFSYEVADGKQEQFTLYPIIVGDGQSLELISLDVDTATDAIMSYGNSGSIFSRLAVILRARIGQPTVELGGIQIQEELLQEELVDRLEEYQQPAQNASVRISQLVPLEYEVTSSTVGRVYDVSGAIEELRSQWAMLSIPQVVIPHMVEEPTVTVDDVINIEAQLAEIVSRPRYTLSYTDERTGATDRWYISPQQIAQWMQVEVVSTTGPRFTIDPEVTKTYLEDVIGKDILVEAQDARFEKDGDSVREFQGSRAGIAIDSDQTYDALLGAFFSTSTEAQTVEVVVQRVEPTVTTADVNDLGITEVLGVGVSDFSGSPSNRIRNIRNAVGKLNGILVPPGEEFSTIAYTKPYTIEGGYLPELVIKGDEIKPEIGGGLCQIGTTLFRMAMNSGMDIVERRNHSLVVNYYNDLENGLPGTDATLYDPAPDFRFKNDTGYYILIETDMNVNTGRLTFTLWGTSDGRTAHYTRPVVHRWIPYGEPSYIETTKLAPGEVECQHAYRGADTSFSYVRKLADGTVEEEEFTSHYRPLQKICLVGVTDVDACEVSPDGATTCAPQTEDTVEAVVEEESAV